jgi:hypothetical protein
MTAGHETELGSHEEEPLPPPWPLPRFRKLSRRQSIVGWLVGLSVGIAVGAAAVMLIAPTHWI